MESNQPTDSSAFVLVVDDSVASRVIVRKTLDRLGFSTLTAADGAAALMKVHESHPQAIVTDLDMPVMNGETLIDQLRQGDAVGVREIPIIVSSSNENEATLAKLDKLNVDAVVPKPVDTQLRASKALQIFAIA